MIHRSHRPWSIGLPLVDSNLALEASERLPDDDRELLLRDIAKQILQQLPANDVS